MRNVEPVMAFVVELEHRTERYTKIDEALPLLKELAGGLSGSRKKFRDDRLKLGAALVQLRAQAAHGEWEGFLSGLAGRLHLNRHSLFNAMAAAEKLCDRRGRLSREKVKEAGAHLHRGADLKLPRMGEISLRKCEELAGRRSINIMAREEEILARALGDGAEVAMGDFASGGRLELMQLSESDAASGAAGTQLTLDGVYAEAGALMRRVEEADLSLVVRSQVEEETRAYVERVNRICGWGR